jgi:hypothetical protein
MTEDTSTTKTGDEDAAATAAAEKGTADADAAKAAEPEADELDEELLKDARNPDAVKAAIKAERENAKAAKKAAEEAQAELDKARAQVKEFEDRDKSDQEKAEQRAADAEKKTTTAETKLLKLEVGLSKKLPVELAELLSGETRQEMEKHADKLLKVVQEEDTVSVDGGVRKTTKAPDDMNSRIRAEAGR